ncbi:MAG: CDP-glucose 4,6-dehydratase [Acidocella sp.]|nr:CDP-glucose 4,6-dehydratase [Acidocella sp.]
MSRTLPSPQFWAGKRVFLTGHTGFKGGWLALWLSQIGATLRGYALAPNSTPDFFSICGVEGKLHHEIADIRDAAMLTHAIKEFAPDIVLHLAAQPLVRASYAQPLETYSTNIMGTANLLDAVRQTPSVQVTIIVTSDKVYSESTTAHAETARLGGHDPYSASKACAELVAASFPLSTEQKLATVRGGNVIGGGDWSAERLLPDFFRAMAAGEFLTIRSPNAIRPWQHVLDPLCGYLLAAEHLWNGTARRSVWNFGPPAASEVSVEKIIGRLCEIWGSGAFYTVEPQPDAPHEAPVLRLNAEKARRELGWQPGALDVALTATAAWYRAFMAKAPMQAFTLAQIEAYCRHD